MTESGNNAPKKKVGLASVSLERRKEIASLGGKAAHANGNTHEWTPLEARAAGRLGGKATRRKHAVAGK